MRLLAVFAAAALLVVLAGVYSSSPAIAADLSKDVQALQRTVGDLQRELAQEKRKNADIQALEQKFEKRVTELEKKGGFGKSQVTAEMKLSQLQSQFNALQSRVQALEQAVNASGGSGNNSLSSLDSRLDALESRIQISGSTLKLTGAKIELNASGQLKASGSTASMNFGTTTFSGVVKSNSVITDSVVSKSYTPGAGNVW